MWSESPVTGERKVRVIEVQYFDGGHTGSGGDGIWTQLLLIHCTVPMFPGFEYDAKNSAYMYMCMLSHFGRVWLFVTPWTIPCQAMGFSRHEYWRGLPCPPPGDLPNPGIKPASLISPVLAGGFFTTNATWEALSVPLCQISSWRQSFRWSREGPVYRLARRGTQQANPFKTVCPSFQKIVTSFIVMVQRGHIRSWTFFWWASGEVSRSQHRHFQVRLSGSAWLWAAYHRSSLTSVSVKLLFVKFFSH